MSQDKRYNYEPYYCCPKYVWTTEPPSHEPKPDGDSPPKQPAPLTRTPNLVSVHSTEYRALSADKTTITFDTVHTQSGNAAAFDLADSAFRVQEDGFYELHYSLTICGETGTYTFAIQDGDGDIPGTAREVHLSSEPGSSVCASVSATVLVKLPAGAKAALKKTGASPQTELAVASAYAYIQQLT